MSPAPARGPRHAARSDGYGRYVGRVGALAVALGIGAAIANNPGIALADELRLVGGCGLGGHPVVGTVVRGRAGRYLGCRGVVGAQAPQAEGDVR